MNQTDPEEYRIQIEEEILDIIESKLVRHEIDAERARGIAKLVIETLHPHMEIEEMREVVGEYDKYFTELTDIAVAVSHEEDSLVRDEVMKEVQRLVDEERFDEARSVLGRIN